MKQSLGVITPRNLQVRAGAFEIAAKCTPAGFATDDRVTDQAGVIKVRAKFEPYQLEQVSSV